MARRLLAALLLTGTSALSLPGSSALSRPQQDASRRHRLVRAAEDEPDIAPDKKLRHAIIVPDKLPSFGLTERENLRLSYMVRREEPLFQEVFGLQMLFGWLGAFYSGAIGLVVGAGQLAPLLGFCPGRAGHLFRGAGYRFFVFIASVCDVCTSACKFTKAHWQRLAEQCARLRGGDDRGPAATMRRLTLRGRGATLPMAAITRSCLARARLRRVDIAVTRVRDPA